MKRDWELIRCLLLHFEGDESNALDKYDEQLIMEHTRLLVEGGYLKDIRFSKDQAGAIIGMTGYGHCNLTMSGYDLLDSIRQPDIWEKVFTVIKKHGGKMAVEIVVKLAQHYIEAQLGL